MNTLSEVCLTHSAAFLPNAPVGNDEMEAVLGMVGDTPSRVRQMILRSNAIRSRHYAIDPASSAVVWVAARQSWPPLRWRLCLHKVCRNTKWARWPSARLIPTRFCPGMA